MKQFSHWMQDFAKVFNPDQIDGNKLIDSKSGYAISYSTSEPRVWDKDLYLQVVVRFHLDNQVIRTWGMESANDPNLDLFFRSYLEQKAKIKRLKDAEIERVNEKVSTDLGW